MNLGRRSFIIAALASFGLAAIGYTHNDIILEPQPCDEVNSTSEYKHALEEAVSEVIPDWIIAKYNIQYLQNKDTLKNFKLPNGVSNDILYWKKKFIESAKRLKELDTVLDMKFFEDNNHATMKMLENGYAYAYLDSLLVEDINSKVPEDINTFLFGEIIPQGDNYYVNELSEEKRKHRVIEYNEIVPTFEDYIGPMDIFAMHVNGNEDNEDLIFINRSTIRDYVRSSYDLAEKLYTKDRPLSFYESMLVREFISVKDNENPQNKLEENTVKAWIYHEIGHFEKKDSPLIEQEIYAFLNQIYHQPFLTFGILYTNIWIDTDKNDYYKDTAIGVFKKFMNHFGYSSIKQTQDMIEDMTEERIRKATKDIIKEMKN